MMADPSLLASFSRFKHAQDHREVEQKELTPSLLISTDELALTYLGRPERYVRV